MRANSCTYKGSYTGSVSKTRNGHVCQKWNASGPHTPKVKPEMSNHNKCRNPDGDPNGPWCYTTSKSVRWEYCDIPECRCDQDCLPKGDAGLQYNGKIAQTKFNDRCQKWNSNTPHKPTYKPADSGMYRNRHYVK